MNNVDKNTFLDINLKAINLNYQIIKKKINKSCVIAASVKADAYGLGANKIVSELIKNGCSNFFVATTSEAIVLRKLNKKIKIYILNGLVVNNIRLIKKYNLIPVINNLLQLKNIEKFQKKNNYKLKIALQFDTGMSRLGFDRAETNLILNDKKKLIRRSDVALVMSHLACADNKHSKKNFDQLKKFKKIIKFFPEAKYSLSNSAGILLGKKYHFDMVRPGISLFGGHCQIKGNNQYKNVISLKAKIIQIRTIEKNETVGYGATFKAKKNMIIGTIPIGYADGFNRLFSNNYSILINDSKAKFVGRISMDLITIDLTNIKNLNKVQDEEIEIIGNRYNINDIAKLINTIPYEILTNLGKRYQRRYI